MNKKLSIVAALGLALAGGSASAEIMYTPWQTVSTDDLQPTTGAQYTLTFDQYDSSDYGGFELHNVEIELDTTGYAVYQFADLSGAMNTFTFDASMTVVVDGDGVADLVVALPDIIDEERTVDPFGVYQSPGFGPPPVFEEGLSDSDSDAETYVGPTLTPAIIALFAGTGTVDLFSSATIANETSSTGDNSTTLLSRYEAEVRVRYSYEVPDVPEPSTMLLFGVGLAGAGFAARRRAKKGA